MCVYYPLDTMASKFELCQDLRNMTWETFQKEQPRGESERAETYFERFKSAVYAALDLEKICARECGTDICPFEVKVETPFPKIQRREDGRVRYRTGKIKSHKGAR